jgi:hypothetical protein
LDAAGGLRLRVCLLVGREFVDDLHLDEQLAEWMATIADVRIHGTVEAAIRRELAKERGIHAVARAVGVGAGPVGRTRRSRRSVQRVRAEPARTV